MSNTENINAQNAEQSPTEDAILDEAKRVLAQSESTENEKKPNKFWRTVWSYLVITVGTIIIALGIYVFKFPNNFATGGVSSIALILANFVSFITEGQIVLILNVLLLIVALIVFGKNFAIKTIYSSLLLSVTMTVLEIVWPITQPLTDQKFLELIYGIGGVAVGSAILFNEGASSGGTDIIAMMLKKFFKMETGTALFFADFVLAVIGCFTFGIEAGMYSILGLVIKAFIVDGVIDNINLSKCCIIITQKDAEICEYINKNIRRGATIADCKGAFTHKDKKLIITVVNRPQAIALKAFIKSVDKEAFTIVTNSSDILGKGFRTVL